MVIACPECSTKFRVKPERIPEAGAKVRCARCKHVFLATKPEPVEEPPLVIDEPEEQQVDFSAASDFSAEVAEEEPASEEEGFSYDQFRELDETTPEEESFTFGDDESVDETDFGASATEETEAVDEEQASDSFSFSTEEESTADEEQNGPPVTENEQQPAEDQSLQDETETEEEPQPQATTPHKSSPAASIIKVLLLLILGLIIIGGALYLINRPEQIEQAIQQIIGQHLTPTESGEISLNNLEGKFINNQEAGELFVISGVAINNFKEPRSGIQVKGIIFDQNGKPLLQKTIFCGNPINDQELQTLPFSKLEEMMRNQFGESLANMKVNNKEEIPFVIAFRDLPQNLSEFSVDVTTSEPVAK